MSNIDLAQTIQDISLRISKLEKKITSPNYTVPNGSAPTFTSIGVGVPGSPGAIIGDNPLAPTGLTYSTQANFNDVSVTATWTASGDKATVGYDVLWEIKNINDNVYTFAGSARVAGTSHTLSDALPGRTYRAVITSISFIGDAGDPLSSAGTIVAATDATIPGALGGFVVVAGATSLTAMWDDSTEPDVKAVGSYQIQVDDEGTFAAPLLYDQFTTASIVSFTGLTADAPHWLRVRPVDASGNEGPWSGPIQATPSAAGGVFTGPVTQEMLDPGIIADEHIVTAGLSAATIKFGTMNGDRITLNTLTANALKTSTLSAKGITLASGGYINGGTSLQQFTLDSGGFRLYKNVGGVATLMVDLNASTGDAMFKGAVNATSGHFTGNITSEATITGGTVQGAQFNTGTLTTENRQLLMIGYQFFYTGIAQESVGGYSACNMVNSGGAAYWNLATYAGRPIAWNGSGTTLMTPSFTMASETADMTTSSKITLSTKRTRFFDNTVNRATGLYDFRHIIDNTGGEIINLTYTQSSARDIKEDITELTKSGSLSTLRKLRPVQYKQKNRTLRDKTSMSLIAEEVAEAFPDAASYEEIVIPGAGAVERGKVIGYDLTAILTLAIAGLQGLDERMDVIEQKMSGGGSV